MPNRSTAKLVALQSTGLTADEDKNSTVLDKSKAIYTEAVRLFSALPVNVSEDKVIWVEQLPVYQTKGPLASIQFHIPGTGTQYTDLSRTELYMKLKIVDDTGRPFVQDKKVKTAIPIDMIMHTMWSMVDIKFNQTLVSSSGTNYMYKAYIENLLTYNAEAKKYQLAAIGWTGDEGNFDAVSPQDDPLGYGINQRYQWLKAIRTMLSEKEIEALEANEDQDEKEKEITLHSNEIYEDPTCIEYSGPLLADICNQDRLILDGVNIDIKLFPNKDEFRLIVNPPEQKPQLIIEECKLLVCKVNVDPEVVVLHSELLQKTPALYPFQRTDLRTFNVNKGSYETTLEDIWQGEVPSRLIVGIVDAKAYSGSYTTNPLRFKHHNLQTICFSINGESVPRPAFQLDFKDCGYLEGLLSLYKVSGKLFENTDIGISRETYRQGYSLIGFEIDPTAASDFSYLGKPKSGRTRLTLRFHKALQNNITIILFATFPETLEIDQTRLVSLKEKERVIDRLRIGM